MTDLYVLAFKLCMAALIPNKPMVSLLPEHQQMYIIKAAQQVCYKETAAERMFMWSLDKGAITEVILHKILGFHISELLNHRLVEKGLKLKFKNGDFLIESSTPYQPIYFNENTGKIVVIEDANQNKDYVFKYQESKGWFQIGKL